MKAVKYFLVLLLFLMGFIVASEKYQTYLSSFQSFYSVSFYCDGEEEFSKMLEDVNPEQRGYDIDLFYTMTEYSGEFDSTVFIYCSEKTKQKMIEEYRYLPGTTKSLFFGQTTIQYAPMNGIPYARFEAGDVDAYLFGKYDDMMTYKSELIDLYGGSYPRLNGYNELRESKILISIAWLVAAGIILGLTYYSRLAGRKEYFVRSSLGDTLMKNALLQTAADAVAFASIFWIEYALFSSAIGKVFCFPNILVIFAVLLVLNSLLYLTLPLTKYRYAVSNATISENALRSCRIYHFIVLTLLLLLVSSSAISLGEYRRVCSREEFYKKYDGYFYVQFYGRNFDLEYKKEKEAEFYSTYLDERDICLAMSIIQTEDFNVYGINYNMRWYLKELLGNLADETTERITCYYPKGVARESIEQSIYPIQNVAFGASEDEDIVWVEYSKQIEAADQGEEKYSLCANPVIVYNPKHNLSGEDNIEAGHALRLYLCYVKGPEEEIKKIAEGYGLRCYCSDVYGKYKNYKTNVRRIFVTSLAFSLALLLMECVLSVSLVWFEFEAEKMEIAVLKTMGMSNWYRYKKLYLLTAASGILSIGVSSTISHFMGYGNTVIVIILGIAVVGLDILFLKMLSKRNEAFVVSRTLKNG